MRERGANGLQGRWITWKTCGYLYILCCYIAGISPATVRPFILRLVRDHMTSNNETVSRQMPGAGNIAKTMTSNRKQFTVTRKMLTTLACHLSIKWSFVFDRFDPFLLLYNKSLNVWSLGEQWIFNPSNLNVSLSYVSGIIEILSLRFSGKKFHCSPRDQSLRVNYEMVASLLNVISFCLLVSVF